MLRPVTWPRGWGPLPVEGQQLEALAVACAESTEVPLVHVMARPSAQRRARIERRASELAAHGRLGQAAVRSPTRPPRVVARIAANALARVGRRATGKRP